MSASTAQLTASNIDSLPASVVSSVANALSQETVAIKTFLASQDAITVKAATDGMGTDEEALIDVLCNRTKAQLDLTSAACVSLTGKTLLQIVSGDVGGNFGALIKLSLMDIDDYGATVITTAVDGVGTNEAALLDLVMTRTNAEMSAIKKKWEARNNAALIDKFNSEFGSFSKDLKKAFVTLYMGGKSESTSVDAGAAKAQATRLYKAGEGKMGTNEDEFIDILCKESRAQIQAIKAEYEKQYNKSLKLAIEKEMNGDLEKLMVATLQPSIAASTALALNQAFSGVGTDDNRVCRILGGTDKKMMVEVCALYLENYGKTLKEALKSELSGDFEKACIAWCEPTDPSGGLEYQAKPTDPKALAKYYLTERTNLRSYVALVDAKMLNKSMKGVGTDDDLLIRLVCSRTKEHLHEVDMRYHQLYSKGLGEHIKSETSGDYEDFLVGAILAYDEFDALMMKKACAGIGTNEQILIEVLAPHNNARIQAMRKKYEARYGQPLIDTLNSELSGNLKSLIITLLKAERDERAPVNQSKAAEQAQALHDAGVGQWGTQESVFIEVFCKSSRAQIEAVKAEYEKKFNHSLRKAIEKETSGDMETCLVALTYDPHQYYASLLKQAFKGIGTNEDAVIRTLCGLDKPEITVVNAIYLENYGQTLAAAIDSELGGNLKKAALTWVSAKDPLDLEPLKHALAGISL